MRPGVQVSPLRPRRRKLVSLATTFLCVASKSHPALTPLLLLSISNPLRWALIWRVVTGTLRSFHDTPTNNNDRSKERSLFFDCLMYGQRSLNFYDPAACLYPFPRAIGQKAQLEPSGFLHSQCSAHNDRNIAGNFRTGTVSEQILVYRVENTSLFEST